MVITKEQKSAVLKSVQTDLLEKFKFAKSVETNATCDDRLKIESVKSSLMKLHESVDKLIKFYETFQKD